MRYKIDVLRKDINNGVCDNVHNCAVALALNRRFGKKKGYAGAEVDEYSAILYLDDTLPVYVDFPQKTTRFIQDFDATADDRMSRKKLKPFSFTVNV